VAVVKIIELVGSSKTSTDDAAMQALQQAQSSLRNIRAVDIVSTGIRGENLDEYRAHVRVAFLIEGTDVDWRIGTRLGGRPGAPARRILKALNALKSVGICVILP